MKKAFPYLIVFLYLAVLFQANAEKTKQALRALEKEDYEKVEEILIKSMDKDSLNPATAYVWSLLYSNENYPGFHLDTAHFYIQNACEYFKLQDEDHLDELDDSDLYEYDLKNKKIAIDSMAFEVATSLHNVPAYDHFIEIYSNAAEVDQAIVLRNQLIFAKVEAEHTWQAYAAFIAGYPLASQVEKANMQYDKLIYLDKTKSGKTIDLERFLKEEPNTPYRHSIEKKIFEDYVGELKPYRIIDFLRKYKNSVLEVRALSMLYHLDDFDFSSIEDSYEIPANFIDSANQLETLNKEPLFVYRTDSVYQFFNLNGDLFFSNTYEGVNEAYKCGNILNDLLEVTFNDTPQCINRMGEVVFDGYSGEIQDLGSGLLEVEENGQVGLFHKSGFRLLPTVFDELRLLQNSLIVFSKQDKLGVMTITGKELIKPAYDRIERKGNFWIFNKDGFFGVSNLEKITTHEQENFELKLPFEEVELINNKYIIGFKEDVEVLINDKLDILSPTGTKRINTRHETWVMEVPEGYTTFDPDLGQLSSSNYQQVLQNTEWLGLTRNGKWFVYNKNIYDEPIIGVDSLKLLGEDIAIVFRGTDGMAIFPNKKFVEIVENQYLMSIGPEIKTNTHYLVVREKGENILYKDGQEQFRLVCDELGYISDSAFYVKKNGNYGAVGLDGKLIMRIRYDAISQAENEVAPVLYNGKFGAYNFQDRILLRIEYQEKLKPYNYNLFIVNLDGQYGLLDRYNKISVEPKFEQIAYWSDSTFLGQKDGTWSIVNIKESTDVLSDIQYYEYIKETSDERILLIRKEEGYGVYHHLKGVIVPTVFHDVINLGNEDKPLYFTETAVSEANIYVVVYYDSNGKKLFSEAYRNNAYENLVCED